MRTDYLLPHIFKKIGWFVFVPAVILFMVGPKFYPLWDDLISFPMIAFVDGGFLEPLEFFKIENTGMLDELLFCLTLTGVYMICFSRRTVEDEFIQYLRTKSLVWALKVSIILLAILMFFCFGVVSLYIICFSTYFTCILFECRFQYELYKAKKKNEE